MAGGEQIWGIGPRMGLGTAPLGLLYEAVPAAEATAVIQTAYTFGVRFFDTAPLYGRGLAERRLGSALAGIPRKSYWVSSKVGYVVPDDLPAPSLIDPRPPRDYTPDAVQRSLEGSLKRLGTEYLDVVLIHDADAPEHFAEVMEGAYPILTRWRAEGTVRAIGIGTNHVATAIRFLEAAEWDCLLLAGRYTVLDRSAATLLSLAQRREVVVMMGGVLNSGILANPDIAMPRFNYQPAAAEQVVRAKALAQTCQAAGVSLLAAALQFPLRHPAVRTILLSARSSTEWEKNWEALHQPIPEALWTVLDTWRDILV